MGLTVGTLSVSGFAQDIPAAMTATQLVGDERFNRAFILVKTNDASIAGQSLRVLIEEDTATLADVDTIEYCTDSLTWTALASWDEELTIPTGDKYLNLRFAFALDGEGEGTEQLKVTLSAGTGSTANVFGMKVFNVKVRD